MQQTASFTSPRSFAEDAKSLGFTSVSDILGREFPVDLIRDLFPQVGSSCLYGAPGTGKSFVAFHIVMSVAAGLDVLGRRSLQGMAVYLSTEGKSGMKARAIAWARARNIDITDLPVAFIEEPRNLRGEETVATLIERIKRLEASSGIPCRFICVDTLSQCLFGDENRQEDMAQFTGAMTRLANALGTQVCVVHHSGKDKSKGARGSSVINGNFDTLFALEEGECEGQIVLRTDKQKNGGKAAVSIVLEKVECGFDGDGEPVYSLVVSDESGELVDVGNGNQPDRPSRALYEKKLLEVLRAAGPDGLEPLAWRKQAQAAGVGPNRVSTAHNLIKELVENGIVEKRPDGRCVPVSRRPPP
ncbi:MAG: AAA family ATPase [Parvibaculum sp.]|uniref:AAA family ATPase n=1 Tax=Parvibaculum sp. TaxID=2024848 RepID=UPI0032ED6CF5